MKGMNYSKKLLLDNIIQKIIVVFQLILLIKSTKLNNTFTFLSGI